MNKRHGIIFEMGKTFLKNKLKPASRLACVLAVTISLFILPGCYTKSELKTERQAGYDQGFRDCDGECIELQKKIKAYIKELETKNRVLKKFNQIDDNDNLWNEKDTGWDDDAIPEGFDSWAK